MKRWKPVSCRSRSKRRPSPGNRFYSGSISSATATRRISLFQEKVIDCFVNSIYLFDDRIVVNFNYQEGGRPVSLEEVLSSFLDGNGAPKNAFTRKCRAFFLLLYFKKARSGAPSGILEQGGGTQCRKERHSAAFLSPRESPRWCTRKSSATNVAAFLSHHSLRDGLTLRASARVRLAGTLLFTHRLLWNNGSWSANYYYILQITPLPTPPPIWLRWRRWQAGVYSPGSSFAAY